jgi:hypothetical protein
MGPLRAGRQRGQSLVVAIMVLFILLFIGGIFVALVARNLQNSGRSRDTVAALELARAGVQYCDTFLMNSPEGADWRPQPSPPRGPQDPDYRWLVTKEWTRIPLKGGRALVRVDYRPDYNGTTLNPLSKSVRIDAVGRVGEIDENDPTSFLNSPAPRLRRQLTAYKAIGITDYTFFETNKDRDTKAAADFGVPPVAVAKPDNYTGPEYPLSRQIGNLPVMLHGGSYYLSGGSIRANMDLRIHGDTRFVMDPRRGDAVLSSGQIKVEPNEANRPPRVVNLSTNPNQDPETAPQLLPSDSPSFNTYQGLVRDGSDTPDPNGYPRSISRLDPPLLDHVDPATGVTRYRNLTRNSGFFFNNRNTGWLGMGGGLYINNPDSADPETERAGIVGSSMRGVWLTPGADPRWKGPHFNPAGAFIEIGYPVVQARDEDGVLKPDVFEATPGFEVTRDGAPGRDRFFDPSGGQAENVLAFTFFIYKPRGELVRPQLKLESEFFRRWMRGQGLTEQQINQRLPEFNGVVFAEGNLRVRGILPDKMKLAVRYEDSSEKTSPYPNVDTSPDGLRREVSPPALSLVSNSNIYIEGNIIREKPDSCIGLLARNYVVVNTTNFVSNSYSGAWEADAENADERGPRHAVITSAERGTIANTLDFANGENPSLYRDLTNNQVPIRLLARHGTNAGGVTYLNLFVNPWSTRAPIDPRYPFGDPATTVPQNDAYIAVISAKDATGNPGTNLFQDFLTLSPKPNDAKYLFTNDPGYEWPLGMVNRLRPQVGEPPSTPDASGGGNEPAGDYWLGRAVVTPMDIRIEAVIYAQNGSFFVIPGRPVNEDASDTPDAAQRRALAQDPSATNKMLRPDNPRTHPYFPFHYQPIDCRITVIGAIAENRPAAIADQAAWMQLWGYIPEVYGSTGRDLAGVTTEQTIPTSHIRVRDAADPNINAGNADLRTQAERNARITRGLRIIYDPILNAPYYGPNAPFRKDDAGRTLPPVPRLPVCPGFVYYGEVG